MVKRRPLKEEDVCAQFWRGVEELKARKVIGQFDIFCISNNQRGNSLIRQVMDKRVGVTKGVADYCVNGIGYMEAKRIDRYNKNGTYHVSTQTPEQLLFEADCIAKGLKYATFHTAGMGIDILLSWVRDKRAFIPASEYLKTISPTELMKMPI